jgi:hypothetical protein
MTRSQDPDIDYQSCKSGEVQFDVLLKGDEQPKNFSDEEALSTSAN